MSFFICFMPTVLLAIALVYEDQDWEKNKTQYIKHGIKRW